MPITEGLGAGASGSRERGDTPIPGATPAAMRQDRGLTSASLSDALSPEVLETKISAMKVHFLEAVTKGTPGTIEVAMEALDGLLSSRGQAMPAEFVREARKMGADAAEQAVRLGLAEDPATSWRMKYTDRVSWAMSELRQLAPDRNPLRPTIEKFVEQMDSKRFQALSRDVLAAIGIEIEERIEDRARDGKSSSIAFLVRAYRDLHRYAGIAPDSKKIEQFARSFQEGLLRELRSVTNIDRSALASPKERLQGLKYLYDNLQQFELPVTPAIRQAFLGRFRIELGAFREQLESGKYYNQGRASELLEACDRIIRAVDRGGELFEPEKHGLKLFGERVELPLFLSRSVWREVKEFGRLEYWLRRGKGQSGTGGMGSYLFPFW